ncbi:hypothetical protein LCGC14_2288130, partial [marine sediment metagenome]
MVPVWKSLEDQLDHMAGNDVEPLYT